jgi:hypothetical protein
MEQCAREAPVTGRANRSGTAPLPRRPESPGWLHMHRLRRDLPESISPFPLSIFFFAYPTGCWVGSCCVVWCGAPPRRTLENGKDALYKEPLVCEFDFTYTSTCGAYCEPGDLATAAIYLSHGTVCMPKIYVKKICSSLAPFANVRTRRCSPPTAARTAGTVRAS